MARRVVTICTDDLTGEELPEDQVKDVPLRFGNDEWTLTLTEASADKVRALFAHVVEHAPYTDRTPKWARNPQEPASSQQPPANGAVTVVPTDNKTVRRWWGDLTAAQRKTLGLKAPTANPRGRIPDDVVAAFTATHAVASPQFTG